MKAAVVFALITVSLFLFYISFRFQTIFTLNLSPVPNVYVKDFIEGLQQEEKETTYYNWMVDRSQLLLPIKTYECTAVFEMRAKRALSRQGYLYVFINGNRTFMKNIQGDKYEIIRFNIPKEYITGKDINIQFRTYTDEANHRRGMRVDWIRIYLDRGADGYIVPSNAQTLEFLFSILLIALLMVLLPMDFKWKAGLSAFLMLIFTAANTFFRIEASLLLPHLNRWAFIPAIITVAGFKALRRLKKKTKLSSDSFLLGSNYLPACLIFFVTQTVRVIGTFYYQYFYPDLRSYHNFMSVLDSDGIVGFAYWYGHHHLKILYGYATAFPYSPLFHITIYPLTKLNYDFYIWLRVTSTIFNTIFIVLIYLFILKFLKDKRAAVFGGIFASFSAVMFRRIFLCMYSALFSGLLTFIVIFFLFFFIRKTDDWRYRWLGFIIIALALLSYPSALLNLMLFFAILLLYLLNPLKIFNKKKSRWKMDYEFKPLILLILVGAALAFFIYYVYFVEPILTELIPFLTKHSDKIVWNQNIKIGFFEYLAERMNFYISIPGMLLVFPGLWLLLKKRMDKYHEKFIYSWLFAWFIIYILSAPQLLSFMLRLGKEELFILPLFATAAGAACSHFWKKGKIFQSSIIIILIFYLVYSLAVWISNIKSFMVFIE